MELFVLFEVVNEEQQDFSHVFYNNFCGVFETEELANDEAAKMQLGEYKIDRTILNKPEN